MDDDVVHPIAGRLLYLLRFFDADWNEITSLAIRTGNVRVVSMHLRLWREAILRSSGIPDHLLAPLERAKLATVEVDNG